jgi:hypothetical protein
MSGSIQLSFEEAKAIYFQSLFGPQFHLPMVVAELVGGSERGEERTKQLNPWEPTENVSYETVGNIGQRPIQRPLITQVSSSEL